MAVELFDCLANLAHSLPQVIRESWVSEGMPEGLGTTFFLDGAHTPESMTTCAEWFAEASQMQQESGYAPGQPLIPPHRILLFNCMKVSCPVSWDH